MAEEAVKTKPAATEAPEELAPDLSHDETLMKWDTPEYIPLPRTKLWYLVASVIMISLVAYAIFSGSATMAIVFILLSGIFFLTHKHEPRIVEVKFTQLGVEYDKKFYPYHAINAFWIVYQPPYVRSLYLRLGGKSFHYVKIELNHMNPIAVRKLLSREVPELEGAGEHLIDIFIRLLRLQ